MNVLEYKGYHAKVEYDSVSSVLFGKLEGIGDLVTFQSNTLGDVERELHDAVDDYLDFCKRMEKNPDKEYKGSFNVRLSPEMHRKLTAKALKDGDTLNGAVVKAIASYIGQ